MKKYLVIIQISLFISCSGSTKRNPNAKAEMPITQQKTDSTKIKSETPIKKHFSKTAETTAIIDGTDYFTYKAHAEGTSTFDYQTYVVNQSPHEEYNGDVIQVYNKNTGINFNFCENDGCFFSGLIDNYLLLDYGTSSIRLLEIFDLRTNQKIYETAYTNGLELKDDKLFFSVLLDTNESNKTPSCDLKPISGNDIGYTQLYTYDFLLKKQEKMEVYNCLYLE